MTRSYNNIGVLSLIFRPARSDNTIKLDRQGQPSSSWIRVIEISMALLFRRNIWKNI